MGVILRTAGANRTKTEIKRDFEYLMRCGKRCAN
jgi:ribonuclease E